MKKLRKNIFIILPSLWILSTVSMIVAIPLHFLVKEHKTLCEKKGESGCSDSKNTHCEICAFDLYIAYPQKYNFEIIRRDVLLSVFNALFNVKEIVTHPFYVMLRAPPEIGFYSYK